MTRCPLTTRRNGVAHSYGKGPSGREPSAATVNLRLAVISSLYGFLVRMGLVASNPCGRVSSRAVICEFIGAGSEMPDGH